MDIYASAKQKALDSLSEKVITAPKTTFHSVRINPVAVKLFWFVSGVKRKLKRRFGK